MEVSEIFGFAAAGFVLGAFCMRTMKSLRLLSIGANMAFLGYALLQELLPLQILHGVLLPLNTYRLIQEMRRRKEGFA